jgi:hypothetical protein
MGLLEDGGFSLSFEIAEGAVLTFALDRGLSELLFDTLSAHLSSGRPEGGRGH